jgi:hypothetical protein
MLAPPVTPVGLSGWRWLLLGAALAGVPLHAWRTDLYGPDWQPPHERAGLHFLTDEFIQDFSYAGYHRGERRIPDVAGPVYDVTEYGADPQGGADSTDAIQAAILAAERAGGGVVYLPAGSYLVSKPANRNYAIRIVGSNMVLRGAGADKTFLINTSTSMRSSRVIRAVPAGGSNWATPRGAVALLAKDYPGPTRELEVATWLNFQVGDWIVVHNPFTDSVRAGGSFVEDVRMDGTVSATPSWIGQGTQLGGPMMYRQIVAVDPAARTLTLDAPTRWYLLQRDGARVYYVDNLIEEVGFEGFSIGNVRHPSTEFMTENHYSDVNRAAYEMHDSWLLSMERVRNGWIRDVRSFNPGNNNGVHMLSCGLVLDWSRGITVERVEMQRAQYGGGGGNGYMIRLNSVNEVLVRYSRVAYCRHGILIWRMQNSGNVLHRNLDEFTGVQTSNTGTLQNTSGRASDHHGLLSHSNLFDRHVVNQSFVEAAFRGTAGSSPQHGQSSSQSLYWNTEGRSYYTGRSYIVHSEQAGRGYVIGTQGPASGAINTPKSSGSQNFTQPVDRIEGAGLGATLEPASLYEDQLRRRLHLLNLTLPPPASLQLQIERDPSQPGVKLQVPTDFGRHYQLLQAQSLTDGAWSAFGAPVPGTGNAASWSGVHLPVSQPAFFRVLVLP